MNQKIIVKENSPVVLAAGRQNLIVESADIVIPQIGQRRVLILPTGAQGLEGPPGLDGPQGPQGPEGPQPPLSVNEPKPLGVADSGVSVVAARDDHVHAIPNASQIGAALSTHSHSQSDVVNLESSLAQKVSETRVISSGAGLVGGGDLSENRTLSVIYGQTSGTAAQGDDSRFFAPNSGCPYKSGFYYSTAPVYPGAYSFETTSVYLYPWAIGRADVILDRMCVDVRTLASGGKIYLGVYDTVDGVPKNLIGTAPSVPSVPPHSSPRSIGRSSHPLLRSPRSSACSPHWPGYPRTPKSDHLARRVGSHRGQRLRVVGQRTNPPQTAAAHHRRKLHRWCRRCVQGQQLVASRHR